MRRGVGGLVWWFVFDLKCSLGFDVRVSFGCRTELDSHLILVKKKTAEIAFASFFPALRS